MVKQSLIALGMAVLGVCSLGAAEFLTQAEIDSRLEALRREQPSWIGYICRDGMFGGNGKFVPYEYKCPVCGKSTWYRQELGRRAAPGVSNCVAWAREAVGKLRALRLDINVDERGYCDWCRVELKLPDGGEILRIPDDWPERGTMHVFPFEVSDKVDIIREQYDNIYSVAKKEQDYWVPARRVTKEWKLDASRTIPLHVKPNDGSARIATINRWWNGRVIPNSESNGWVRYESDYPFTVGIPKEMVGSLTYAGEKTKRFDTKRLRWTINGRNVRIDDMSSDVIVLETFLRGECKLPNWSRARLRGMVRFAKKSSWLSRSDSAQKGK